MIMQVTDCTCGMSAVSTRRPLSRVRRWNTLTTGALAFFGSVGAASTPRVLAGRSCGQFLPPLMGDLDRLAGAVVVGDEDALGLGDDSPADAQLVVEVEALAAETARAHRDLDLLAEADGGAEVDLDAGDDDGHVLQGGCRTELLQERDARRLNVGQEHGVVHVTHRIEVPEANALAVDEHAAMLTMRDAAVVAGEETRRAIFAQPEWLRAVPTDRRLPEGRVLHTGCGTSFHAAQTGGWAEQALELVLAPRQAEALVVVSHEGESTISLEAARAFDGPVWLVTGKSASPLA